MATFLQLSFENTKLYQFAAMVKFSCIMGSPSSIIFVQYVVQFHLVRPPFHIQSCNVTSTFTENIAKITTTE